MEGNELRDFLRELVEFLKANEIAEFDLEQADLKVRLKFAGAPEPVPAAPAPTPFDLAQLARMMQPAPSQAAAAVAAAPSAAASPGAPSAAAAEPATAATAHHTVKSPLVGTFYESPSPGAPPFVKVGDTVEVGQVLCIVEAMKLMNEVESDVAGEVVLRVAKPGQPVEYGQPLFEIRAR